MVSKHVFPQGNVFHVFIAMLSTHNNLLLLSVPPIHLREHQGHRCLAAAGVGSGSLGFLFGLPHICWSSPCMLPAQCCFEASFFFF